MTVTMYDFVHPLTDYLDEHGRPLPGNEPSKFMLSWAALDALGTSKASRQPCELVVIGEEQTEDKFYLVYGVQRSYIEATTDYRHLDGGLHYVCPECLELRGKHRRTCSRRGGA